MLLAYSIPYVQTMFDCPGIKDAHSSNYNIFSRGELPTSKGAVLKICASVNCEGHILHVYVYHVVFMSENIL